MNSLRARGDEIVNLCFHGVGTPQRDLEPGEEKFWIDVDRFGALLDVIRRRPGFRITFDDGNVSDATHALPALREMDLTATFFVLAGRLGKPGSVSCTQLGELVQAGMTVGSHGMAHQSWRSLSDRDLQTEMIDATKIIAQAAGAPVREVACPFGSYDRRVLRMVRRHRFIRVYTVDGGSARSSAWLQSRYTILSHHEPEDIERLARSPRGTRVESTLRTGKSLVKRLR